MPGDYSILKQGTLRKLVNLKSTVQRMLIPDNRVIDYPALEFVNDEELEKAAIEEHEKAANR